MMVRHRGKYLLCVLPALSACRDEERSKDASAPAASPPVAQTGGQTPTKTPNRERAVEATGRTWSFEGQPPGGLPTEWTVASGSWRLVDDATSQNGSTVFAQEGKSKNNVFNVVFIDGGEHADVDLTVRLRAIGGRIDQGGGLVWRANGARNYYIARYNPLEDNYRVYYVKQGRRHQLESADVELNRMSWHTLRVKMVGDRIECFLNGRRYLDTRDGTFAQAGRIGLWTKADARTHFDDVTLRIP